MTLHVALTHRTAYQYDRVIGMAPQVVRLRPAPALPHADLQLLAEDRAQRSLHQLAAGSLRQLLRAHRPSGEVRAVRRDGRSRGRHGRHQSVRLLRRGRGQGLAVRLRARAQGRAHARISSRRRPGPRLKAFLASLPRDEDGHHRFPVRLEPPAPCRGQLLHPHGAGDTDARGDAAEGLRLVPRLRLAAGAGPAPHRLCGALRVWLPHPAAPRREAARRAGGRRHRFHRSARLGRGLLAGRRLDRPRSDLGPAWPARDTSRSRRRRSPRARRPSAGRTSRPR